MSAIKLQFLEELERCLLSSYPASMMVDVQGLQSVEGTIISINKDTEPISIHLESGQNIDFSTLVAINGIFDQKYLGC